LGKVRVRARVRVRFRGRNRVRARVWVRVWVGVGVRVRVNTPHGGRGGRRARHGLRRRLVLAALRRVAHLVAQE